jgi:hypothetical protein
MLGCARHLIADLYPSLRYNIPAILYAIIYVLAVFVPVMHLLVNDTACASPQRCAVVTRSCTCPQVGRHMLNLRRAKLQEHPFYKSDCAAPG